MDIPKLYKGKYLGTDGRGNEIYNADYYLPSRVKQYVEESQAEIAELVDMLEGATNIITGKEVSPIIYNVAKATARIAKHRGE